MKITSLTLLIAAVAGMSFSQAAYASNGRGMRFDYDVNEFALDGATGHRGGRYAPPHAVLPSVAAGAVPKSHMLDNDFVSRPAAPPPAPAVAAVPVAKPSVSAKVQVPNAFTSLFNPVKSDPALVAAAPGQLPDFGHPNVAKLPPIAAPKAPATHASTNTSIAWKPQHRHPVAALAAAPAFKMPETKGYHAGFTPYANIPLDTHTGSSANTAVIGKLMRH